MLWGVSRRLLYPRPVRALAPGLHRITLSRPPRTGITRQDSGLFPTPFFVRGFSFRDSSWLPPLPLPGPGSCLRETPISRLVEFIFLLCLQKPRKPVPRGLPRGPAPSQTHAASRDCAATLGRPPSADPGARRSTPLPAGGRRRRKPPVPGRSSRASRGA